MQTDALGAYLATRLFGLYPMFARFSRSFSPLQIWLRTRMRLNHAAARLAWGAMLERDRFRLTQERELQDKASTRRRETAYFGCSKARADLSSDLEQNKELLIRAEARYASLEGGVR